MRPGWNIWQTGPGGIEIRGGFSDKGAMQGVRLG